MVLCSIHFCRKCFSINKPKKRFAGHYIVVCGYDNRIGSVFYRNPALDDREFNWFHWIFCFLSEIDQDFIDYIFFRILLFSFHSKRAKFPWNYVKYSDNFPNNSEFSSSQAYAWCHIADLPKLAPPTALMKIWFLCFATINTKKKKKKTHQCSFSIN